ncbi:MAG TPA: hypothetical protein PL188_02215 [Candidatus Cloacimonadota bacterium]|nr:hypothetical protein [Candidatus Cloacimonadota bacterium]
MIRSFENLPSQVSEQRVHWDGWDARGNICGSGVYYIRMQAGKETFYRKAVLMK